MIALFIRQPITGLYEPLGCKNVRLRSVIVVAIFKLFKFSLIPSIKCFNVPTILFMIKIFTLIKIIMMIVEEIGETDSRVGHSLFVWSGDTREGLHF